MSEAKIILGDNRKTMDALPERHFHACCTSPPYYGLRDYGVEGQIGLEPTPGEFVEAMRQVFGGKENPVGVWRVLRNDGVLWLNLGDSYAASPGQRKASDAAGSPKQLSNPGSVRVGSRSAEGFKPKDLIGIPWRVAFALQADGWYLRDAIIWHKPAPMPGSQLDRCTSSYELIFQLTKGRRYFFDLEAIKEPLKPSSVGRLGQDLENQAGSVRANGGAKTNGAMKAVGTPRNDGQRWNENNGRGFITETGSTPRNVWTIASGGYKGAHFATFPVELPLRCIKASTSAKGCCSSCGAPWQRITERTALKRSRPNELTKRTGEEGTGNHCANTVAGVESRTLGWEPTCDCQLEVSPCRVLDPFNGAGTTGVACRRLGVDYVGCELNQEYIDMSYRRLAKEANRGCKHKALKPLVGQAELF